jgi:tetratricopeptide (TPR) repeat protein
MTSIITILALFTVTGQALGGRGGGGEHHGGEAHHTEMHHAEEHRAPAMRAPSAHLPTFSYPTEGFHASNHFAAPTNFSHGTPMVHNPGFETFRPRPVVNPTVTSRPSGFGVGIPNRPNVNNFYRPTTVVSGGGYYGHRPNYYGSWYHGGWHGNWGSPWYYRPWGWGYGGYGGYGYGYGGAGGFGLGLGTGLLAGGLMSAMSPWNWGYYSYSNPYWSSGMTVGMPYLNYGMPLASTVPMYPPQQAVGAPVIDPNQVASQPIAPGAAAVPGPPEQALAGLDDARELFRQGNYQAALDATNQALASAPNDPVMNEFRALDLFALGNYPQAAAAIHAVLAGGPGWDWTTVSGLYGDVNAYTDQLRALEAYSAQNPNAADARFLLAYHYLLSGHNDAATTELQSVVALQPNDQLAAQMLKGLTTPQSAEPPPAQPALPSTPVNPAALAGNWKATRPDGSSFGLNLSSDNKFTWNVNQGGKQQQLTGTYTLANNLLILQANNQDTLIGQVAMDDSNHLRFKLPGGNPADPGLSFVR